MQTVRSERWGRFHAGDGVKVPGVRPRGVWRFKAHVRTAGGDEYVELVDAHGKIRTLDPARRLVRVRQGVR